MSNASYSTPAEIGRFLDRLGDTPLFVCDMDGNVMTGYSVSPRMPPLAGKIDDPRRQSIPFGSDAGTLDTLVGSGWLSRGIFAEKAMDARLPQPLVRLVNDGIARNEPFRLAFLTSRGAEDARILLRESGVRDVDRATLVADSGATLYLNGERREARVLDRRERLFLSALDALAGAIHKDVQDAAADTLGQASRLAPLFVEHKGIATNIHYREILTAAGQGENSALDQALARTIRAKLEDYLKGAEQDGLIDRGAFKLLDGPATIEVKLADINKGHGLESILSAAIDAGKRPSAVVFSGDDVAKGNGLPGTDYFAMVAAPKLSEKFGLSVLNIHTHHPVGNDPRQMVAEPSKSPSTLDLAFVRPVIDLSVPTPDALAELICRVYAKESAARPSPRGPISPSL